jgi:hypothetical protein
MTATATKTLPLEREEPVVDSAFTSRHSEVHIRTGPHGDSVGANVSLIICDGGSMKTRNFPEVLVEWTMDRFRIVNGESQLIEVHPFPHAEMAWRNDEIEAFATALYQAVQLAKKQGYLPKGKSA